jgi:hypothetical protein
VDDNEIDVTHGFNGLLTSLLSLIQLDMKNVLIKAVMIVMIKSHHPGHLPHAKPGRLIAAGLIVIRLV